VAHQLFVRGCQVLIVERSASAHARRGMAFTDALFDGRAELQGVAAQWQADVAAVLACWQQGQSLPIVTLPEAQLLQDLQFDVLIEATMRRHVPPDLRALAPLCIGLGPGYEPGRNCHVAIETQWGEQMGRVLRDRPAAERSGGPQPIDGVGRQRFVSAIRSGTWTTRASLGQAVAAGDALGELDGTPILAPIAGTLRGLARAGVQVRAGHRLIEVDPRVAPQVHGLGERPQAIAAGVLESLGFDSASQ
jgi:xanthine dehydrogenase accessory factor